MIRVFINPGHHPGVDPGAVSEAYIVDEATITGRVGTLVKKYLIEAGCNAKLIQSNNLNGENPRYISVCEAANAWPADLFISIHCNAAVNAGAKGTECFVYSRQSTAADLAKCIQKQIVDSLGTVDRGVKVNDNFIVLKDTLMPAVLIEMAFISNEDDVQQLISKQNEFARAIARGVTDYLKREVA